MTATDLSVAVIAPTVGKHDNGLEVHAVELTRVLSGVPGVHAQLCTVDRGDRVAGSASSGPSGVEVRRFRRWRRIPNVARRVSRRLKPGRARALIERIESPGLSFGLGRHLFSGQAGVAIAVGIYPLTTVQCLLLRAVRCGPPVVLAGLLHFDVSRRISWQHRVSIRLCDGYLALTEAEADVVRPAVRGRCPVAVIPPPLSAPADPLDRAAARAALGLPVEGVLVGFVGRLTWAKDLGVLLDAFSLLANRAGNFALLLAGSTTADTEAIVAASESVAGHRVHVLADFESSQASLIYSALDIFVNPSRLESFGMVFAEAWSYGLPVVGARIPAVADVIGSGDRGLLFEPGNPGSLMEALSRLTGSATLREELGAAGRADADRLYHSDVVAERLVTFVRLVLNQACGG